MPDLLYNKKAKFNYEISDSLVAGIELLGFEVKTLRAKQGSLDGSYVTVRGGEAFLVGAQIPPYQQNNTPKEYIPRRERRLLLTKQEIASLTGQKTGVGLTAIPISMYNVGRKIKVRIGLARNKKKFDKRETIKKRDVNRDIRREFRAR